jgi:hypothetical protein
VLTALGVLAPHLGFCGSFPAASRASYWTPPPIGSVNRLGTIVLYSSSQPARRLLSPTITGAGGPLVCTAANWNVSDTKLTITYQSGAGTVNVLLTVCGRSTGIQAQVDADQPVITSVDMELNLRSPAV